MELKETNTGVLPLEWTLKRIDEICDVKGGKRLPKGYSLQDDNNGFPYIRVSDMHMGSVVLNDIKYVPLDVVDQIERYRISKDDLYISVAGTLGLIGTVPIELDNANLTENADKLCNITCDKDYLYYSLCSERIQNVIENEKTSNAQPKLALTRIKGFEIPLPPLPEQKKIAKILSTVDGHIDEVDGMIEDLKELKKGLMQKLLTEGIGHTEFKDSEVGRIPVEWEVVHLEKLTRKITDGSHSSPIGIDTSDFKICTVKDMDGKYLDLNSATCISEDDYYKLVKNGCNPEVGDVLLSKDGTIGKTMVFNQRLERVVLLSSIAIIRPNIEKLDSHYLEQFLSYDVTLKRLTNTKSGSAIKRIVLKDIKKISIALPTIEEQKAIARILNEFDIRLDLYFDDLMFYKELKKGLMQQLLTGKVRVC